MLFFSLLVFSSFSFFKCPAREKDLEIPRQKSLLSFFLPLFPQRKNMGISVLFYIKREEEEEEESLCCKEERERAMTYFRSSLICTTTAVQENSNMCKYDVRNFGRKQKLCCSASRWTRKCKYPTRLLNLGE